MTYRPTSDLPPRPGASLVDGGTEFCVYAGHANSVQVALFEAGDTSGTSERRVELTETGHGYFWGMAPGVGAGQRYGYRVEGQWAPREGLRYSGSKLLMDPYARGIEGGVTYDPAVYGHVVGPDLAGDPDLRDERDSRDFVPRSVVLGNGFDWGQDRPPATSLSDTVIYEAHVRGLTRTLDGVPEQLRGTYAGMAHPHTVAHLRGLGVTAVELLPIHAFVSEPQLVTRGLSNYWGYNTLGFFAPHAAYAAATDPQGVLDEFKGMVKLLHEAGIEVLLDVVYNHTCEQGADLGPTLSWRGLDNRAYYRIDGRGADIDVTGCGNTLDLRHPVVAAMVLDSLRYWVTECHVDGFRFDLAVALARGANDDFDPNHPFLVALRTDPVLGRVKLIAEPWDVGIHGWRTGGFPPPFSEWNDRDRDTARAFWLSDLARDNTQTRGRGVQELATRLAGSQDLFDNRGRSPLASINFVTAHDGFTLADLTMYNTKHNEANGEDNRDGSENNLSWNHGIEGPVDDAEQPSIGATRRRSMRNLMATLLLSTGVPMLSAGDEFGRSQGGNNNAYCQDNPTSWLNWDLAPWQQDLLATTTHLLRLRRDLPVLRQRRFFEGRQVNPDGSQDLAWYDASGSVMTSAQWGDPETRTVQMALDGAYLGTTSALIVLHGGANAAPVTLASPPGATGYRLLWDSMWDRPQDPIDVTAGSGPVTMTAASVRVYSMVDPT